MKKVLNSLFSFAFILAFLAVGAFFFGGGAWVSQAEEGDNAIPIKSAQDFVDVMSDENNYASGVIIRLESDLDFAQQDGEEVTYQSLPQLMQTKVFQGTFDGNGYTLSNFTISGSDGYFGLFGQTYGATIKNLRISGNIQFSNLQEATNQVYIGAIVGYGEDSTIQNCEIAYGTTFTMTGSEETSLHVGTVTHFGSIAGSLIGGSNITNVISNGNINISLENALAGSTTPASFVGGIVGSLSNSTILRAVSYNALNVVAQSNVQAITGGIVGQISGNASSFHNNVFLGTLTASQSGALIGQIASGLRNGAVSNGYWNNSALENANAVYQSNNFTVVNLSYQRTIDTNFFQNKSNWSLSNGPWDFDTVWMVRSARLYLQPFQSFSFSFNAVLPTQIQIVDGNADIYFFNNDTNARITPNENGVYSIKFGSNISIRFSLQEQYRGYYYVSDVRLGLDSLVDQNNANLWKATDKGEYIEISLPNVSNMISGSYAITLSATEFECLVVSDDISQGGVRTINGQLTDELVLGMTYSVGSTPTEILAQGQGIYTFVGWELYLFDESQGDYSTVPTPFEESGNSTLSINFGAEPFSQRFKLRATFSDSDAMSVLFSINNNDAINSLSFAGQTFEEDAIRVSSQARNVLLEINVKEGYALNEQALINFLGNYYGSNDPQSAISDPIANEDGTTTYRVSLNMAYISEALGTTKEIAIPLTFRLISSGDMPNLLWLWILLPIVVVGGGLTAFFLIRRKKMMKAIQNKNAKEKSVDYRDYYQ